MELDKCVFGKFGNVRPDTTLVCTWLTLQLLIHEFLRRWVDTEDDEQVAELGHRHKFSL